MNTWVWAAYVGLVLVLLVLDLGVLNRGAHAISAKRALGFTAFFVSIALLFGGVVYALYEPGWLRDQAMAAEVRIEADTAAAEHEGRGAAGQDESGLGAGAAGESGAGVGAAGEASGTDARAVGEASGTVTTESAPVTKEEERRARMARPANGTDALVQYLVGWMLEYALSVDNIFVIALIFRFFAVPAQFQHRVLFWGIMGAMVMRGVMIGASYELIERLHWVLYVFGAFLIFTAVKLLRTGDGEDIHPDKNIAVRVARKMYPVAREYDGQKFFTKIQGPNGEAVRAMTPLFLVLLVVETTDVVFAIDSIPAIFGITRDPFLVFTSNVFAILGLRSLYFALAAIMDKFRYLKTALVLVLAFIGVKMLIEPWVHIDPLVSLGVVGTLLGGGVVVSLVAAGRGPSGDGAGGNEAKGSGEPDLVGGDVGGQVRGEGTPAA